MTARTLPINPGGLPLVHQPASRHPLSRATLSPPAARRPLSRFASWWRRLGQIDLPDQEQRRLRDGRPLADSYRWIPR